MYWALIVLHVLVCTFLVLVVLLQAGKGGGIGIAFGGGGSQTVFGSSGAGNFLTRLTAICATIFFLNSLGLAYLSSRSDSKCLNPNCDAPASITTTWLRSPFTATWPRRGNTPKMASSSPSPCVKACSSTTATAR